MAKKMTTILSVSKKSKKVNEIAKAIKKIGGIEHDSDILQDGILSYAIAGDSEQIEEIENKYRNEIVAAVYITVENGNIISYLQALPTTEI